MTHSEYIGRVGPTVTDLRPSGVMLIDKKRVDVITAGDYIDRGTQVQVVDVRGTRIEVRTHESYTWKHLSLLCAFWLVFC